MRVLGCGGACDGCLGLIGGGSRPSNGKNASCSNNKRSDEADDSSADNEDEEDDDKDVDKAVEPGEAAMENRQEEEEEDGDGTKTIHNHPLVGPGQSVAVSRTDYSTHPVGLFIFTLFYFFYFFEE